MRNICRRRSTASNSPSTARRCRARPSPAGHDGETVVTRRTITLVLPDATAEALADSLTGALKGTLKLPSRAACRRYALDRFQWSLVAERTERVYRKVLGGRS